MKAVGYKKPLPIEMIAALEGGDLDPVGIGRAVIADPLTPARLLGPVRTRLSPAAK
jgi:2,4-dienoyl-CoA reductase-like NADH-dependent reductase (Old Yellow Enzyme family)